MTPQRLLPVRRPTSRLMAAVLAGIAAGTVATVAQMALWWLTAVPALETLLRDARLTAAIVMGQGVLSTTPSWRWDILAVATLIHFALSIAYAAPPTLVVDRLRSGAALVAGAGYGTAIYGINLYGFTAFFPWFTVSRGGVTLLTHLVFGLVLAGVCKWLMSAEPSPRSD